MPDSPNATTHQLQWALSSLGAPELGLDEFASLAARYGIEHFELRALGNTLDMPAYFNQYFSQHPQKLDVWRKSGQIYCLDTSFGLSNHDAADRQQLIAYAHWAKNLSVGYLRVFGGFDFNEPLTDQRLETAVEALDWWQSQRDADTALPKLALEMHDGFSSSQRCVCLMQAWGRKLPIVWDAHHSYVTAGETFVQTWETLGDCVCGVHVKDSCPENASGRMEALPGSGDVPMVQLLKLLRDVGFAGPVALEWEKYWHPYLPDLEAALKSMAQAGWRAF
jgi:sugar phosphate isomerase/epimerase